MADPGILKGGVQQNFLQKKGGGGGSSRIFFKKMGGWGVQPLGNKRGNGVWTPLQLKLVTGMYDYTQIQLELHEAHVPRANTNVK